ncbi:MAG: NAD-dependent epimerase/dehydratase family protein [Dokdonella sp.]|uniref:NAD-dependent epimerase/dehydratase family protein n=1 Tax=Dokdonella sp. TaxID=2291710 RepID=UPI003F809AE8
MRIAVTGASGFVGRHAVRALRARGAEVIALSRRAEPALDGGVQTIAFDVADAGADAFARIGRPDALLHLAWGGLPNYRSAHHLERELPLHAAFLEACVRGGLQRLAVAGTCLEYGMHSGQLGEACAAEPVVAYAQAKHALHRRLEELRTESPFGLAWLRLFYLYGPGQAATSLWTQLQSALARGATSFDLSPGDQVRDFIAIEAAATAMAGLVTAHADPGTVNICSGRPATVLDTVRTWLDQSRRSLVLRPGVLPYPDHEPFAFWGSTRYLDELLGAA